jgi:hypothetical protein
LATSKTVNALIATVYTAPLSASEALAIGAFVLVKMDSGFTLKLDAHTLSAEAALQHQQNLPRKMPRTLLVPGEQSAELVEA